MERDYILWCLIERGSSYVTLPQWQNFWMTKNRKSRHLKLFQTSSISFSFNKFVKCRLNFLRLNPKGPYLSLEKEKNRVVFTQFIKRTREIRKFHVVVVLRRLRNVQKSVVHVQSCCLLSKLIVFSPFLLPSPSSSSSLKFPYCCDPKILLPW